MRGKTVLITGACSGIGKETAKELAKRGARILMACPHVEVARKAMDEIVSHVGNDDIKIYRLELSRMRSVRNCAERILENETRLDVLINNAGVAGEDSLSLTPDNLDRTMAINYYGHFLLTNLLIDLLKKSRSRIINVSSSFHVFSPRFEPQEMNQQLVFMHQLRTYGQSNTCMILFCLELSRRFNIYGITANSVDPGAVKTQIFQNDSTFLQRMVGRLVDLIGVSPEEGARTPVFLATSDEINCISGRYFHECEITNETSMARDLVLARKLWESSEMAVNLQSHLDAIRGACPLNVRKHA